MTDQKKITDRRKYGTQIGTWVKNDELELLDRYCDEEERSRSWVLRKALSVFLKEKYGDQGPEFAMEQGLVRRVR